MHARLPCALGGRELERDVLHAERAEDVVLEVAIELEAARGLDHLPDPVDADPVLPTIARIEQQRRRERRIRARRDPRRAGHRLILGDLGPPDLVAEARGVGQQVLQRDRPTGRPEPRLARRVEALQHLDRRELADHVARRLFEAQLAALDELHRRGARDGLGHRRDPHHRVDGHGRVLAELALAEGALVERAAVGRGHRHDPGHRFRLDRFAEHRVERGVGRHGLLLRGARMDWTKLRAGVQAPQRRAPYAIV